MPVSVTEFIALNDKPNCEWIDGVLRPKAWPTRKHGRMQGRVGTLIGQRYPGYSPAFEVTVRINERK